MLFLTFLAAIHRAKYVLYKYQFSYDARKENDSFYHKHTVLFDACGRLWIKNIVSLDIHKIVEMNWVISLLELFQSSIYY